MDKIKKSLVLLVLLVVALGLGSCDLAWINSNQTGLSQALGATMMTGDYLIKQLDKGETSGAGWKSGTDKDGNHVLTLTNFDLKTTGQTEFSYMKNREPVKHKLEAKQYVLSGVFTVDKGATTSDFHAVADCKSLSCDKVDGTISYKLDATAKGLTDSNMGDALTANNFTYNGQNKTSELKLVLGWMKSK